MQIGQNFSTFTSRGCFLPWLKAPSKSIILRCFSMAVNLLYLLSPFNKKGMHIFINFMEASSSEFSTSDLGL